MDEIQSSLEAGDMETVDRQVHSLKGVAGNIGAQDLQKAAEALELALREADQGKIEEELARIGELLEIVLSSIDTLKTKPGGESGVGRDGDVKPDMDKIAQTINQLIPALQAGEARSLEIMNKLQVQVSNLDPEVRAQLREVEELVEGYDFENAKTGVIKITEQLGIDLE